jgi:hypothetical protein
MITREKMGNGDGIDNILEQLSSTKLQFLDFGDEMSNLLETLWSM